MRYTAWVLLATAWLTGCQSQENDPPVASLVKSQTVVASDSTAKKPPAALLPGVEQEAPLKPPAVKPRYRVKKAVVPAAKPVIPPVLLSGGHKKLCLVGVGDSLPTISLPRLDGTKTELSSLLGKQATVVLFWHPDRWMARTALMDMQRDISAQLDPEQVSVVGIAVSQSRGAAQAAMNAANASFPQLLDTAGQAFAAVGTVALPRLYVLDPTGKIVWFDIEYSEGTRRELWQSLRVLTAE